MRKRLVIDGVHDVGAFHFVLQSEVETAAFVLSAPLGYTEALCDVDENCDVMNDVVILMGFLIFAFSLKTCLKKIFEQQGGGHRSLGVHRTGRLTNLSGPL